MSIRFFIILGFGDYQVVYDRQGRRCTKAAISRHFQNAPGIEGTLSGGMSCEGSGSYCPAKSSEGAQPDAFLVRKCNSHLS
jgi:hypothetical protein